jgi:hypothetical protein
MSEKIANLIIGAGAVLMVGFALFLLAHAFIAVKADSDAYEARVAKMERIDKYRKWWAGYHCSRAFYDNGIAVFQCDDGQAYEWTDMPDGEDE